MALADKIKLLEENARKLAEERARLKEKDDKDEDDEDEDEDEDGDEDGDDKKEKGANVEEAVGDPDLNDAASKNARIRNNNGDRTVIAGKDKDENGETYTDETAKAENARIQKLNGDQKVVKTESIDLGALFTGTDLSEEFKAKAVTIFEAAVATRVNQEVEAMEDQLAQRALEESEELKEGLVEKVDGYLDYMIEQWMKNNEIALDRGVKAEIFESFVTKMRDVFVEHNINLPDEEFDLVESLQENTEALEQMLDEQVKQNIELTKTLKEIAKQVKIDEASEGMTDIDAEKFTLLAEELSYEDDESFAKKLETIRENYVNVKVVKEEKQLTEDVTRNSNTPVQESVDTKPQVTADMSRYLRAL